MTEGPAHLNLSLAETGATPETLKATEIVIGIINGFPRKLAYSILLNAVAMLMCHVANLRRSPPYHLFLRRPVQCSRAWNGRAEHRRVQSKTEPEAMNDARHFRRELERVIARNFKHFDAQRRQRAAP